MSRMCEEDRVSLLRVLYDTLPRLFFLPTLLRFFAFFAIGYGVRMW